MKTLLNLLFLGLVLMGLTSVILAADSAATTQPAPDVQNSGGCIDRGYGESSYCPPNDVNQGQTGGAASQTPACIDRGYGEESYCPPNNVNQGQTGGAPADSPACIDRGYGEPSYCPSH